MKVGIQRKSMDTCLLFWVVQYLALVREKGSMSNNVGDNLNQ